MYRNKKEKFRLITNRNVSVWQNKSTNFKSPDDILINLKTEFNVVLETPLAMKT
jgi:hypothetical protein